MILAISQRRRPLSAPSTFALAAVAALLGYPVWAQSPASPKPPNAGTFYRQPPVFVENRGQWDGNFLYRTRAGGMTVFIEKGGWTFTLVEREKKANDPTDPRTHALQGRPDFEAERGVAIGMRFGEPARAASLIPGKRSPGVHNYFLGNDATRWRTGLQLYEDVRLAGVWPGIDVGTRIKDGHFEYDLVVSPGADLERASIEVTGGDGLRIDDTGSLVIETALGPVRQPMPKTWQIGPRSERQPVPCEYVLIDERRFGFRAPAWDGEHALVIDPVLIWSTFLGAGGPAGSNDDRANAVALDATAAATVAGSTNSPSFPTTVGAWSVTLSGASDAFVARLSPAGDALVYCTFLGGVGNDVATAVVLDGAGAATLAGSTTSPNFPTTAGAYHTTWNGGSRDAFIARLSPAGNALVYSTYLGGSDDGASSVAVDATGAATVAGATYSSNFPTTAGAYDTSWNGNADAFVTRLSPAGNALIYSTFLGGGTGPTCCGGWDFALALALDATGAATVAGTTSSPNFPTTGGAYDTSWNGAYDAFVARLSPAGNTLVYSTFIGGGGDDWAVTFALDATGAATVAGKTGSPNFPTTPGAYSTTISSPSLTDGFVTRLNPTGNALIYSTYVGTYVVDEIHALALDAAGGAIVAGFVGGAFGGPSYTGVGRLSPGGNSLTYSALFGGNGDYVAGVALDATGAATVVGYTSNSSFPTTAGAYDPSWNGGNDAFVARLQIGAFASPLMAFPDTQNVPVGSIYGLQVAGPAGAPVALMFDPVAQSVSVSPYGTIGLAIPPLLTFDGIGLGFPGSTAMALSIGSSGLLYFSHSPVPANLVGLTFYAQAVAVHASLAGGAALSTHGNASLPTPACQVTIVP